MSDASQLSVAASRISAVDRLALCLDFDGTLAPVNPDPAAVSLDSKIASLLAEIAEPADTFVAIISGRSIKDIRERVGIEVVRYAGNHGLEVGTGEDTWIHPDASEAKPELSTLLDTLASALADQDCVRIEDKGVTATIHYRDCEPTVRAAIHETVLEVADTAPRIRVTRGRAASQLRPAISWDKGAAVRELVTDWNPSLTVYIGDDYTDEAALSAVRDLPGEGLPIAVGRRPDTAAYRLDSVGEVHELLRSIRTARS